MADLRQGDCPCRACNRWGPCFPASPSGSPPIGLTRWLSSLVLLRRGEGFEARPLLDAAQLGPIRAIAPGDFKGDGRRDLFAAMGFPLLGEPCDAVAEDWNGDGVSDRVVSEAGGGLHWIQSRKADGRSAGEPPTTGEKAREP